MRTTQTETSNPTKTPVANRPARPASDGRLAEHGEARPWTQDANRDVQVVREFERSLIDLERRMDRAVRGFMGEGGLRYPLLQGLALQEGPGGVLGFRPFGSLFSEEGAPAYREPVLTWTVNEEGNKAEFRAEVPGLDKSDIKLEVAPDLIRIEGRREETHYQVECIPGLRIDPDDVHATYEAGILRIKTGLVQPDAGRTRTIAVR